MAETQKTRIQQIHRKLTGQGYIPSIYIDYAVEGALEGTPILIEGAPGVGKTSLAYAVADMMGLELIRVQFYDGLTYDKILYDYDYQKQLLTIQAFQGAPKEAVMYARMRKDASEGTEKKILLLYLRKSKTAPGQTNADHVYIFGNLAWQVNDASIALVSTLKGNKHLIIGNHDKFNNLRFKQLFCEIAPYKEIDDRVGGKNIKAVLSHYPIAFWNGMYRGWIHLYGHVHANSEEQDYQDFISGFGKKYGGEYIARNVGCMHWHYEPVSLEEILAAGSAGYPGMGKAKGAETQPAPQEGS